MKDCIKQKDLQESARDQNNFGLRVEQPSLSDVVNKAIDFQSYKIRKKNKKKRRCRQPMFVKIIDRIPVCMFCRSI